MLIVDSDLFLTFSGRGMLASTRPSFGMLGFFVLVSFFFFQENQELTDMLVCFVCLFLFSMSFIQRFASSTDCH